MIIAQTQMTLSFFLLFSPQSTRSSTEFYYHSPLVILTTIPLLSSRAERSGGKDLGNIHFSLYFSLSWIQRKGNKRLYLSVENLKEVLNDQRELKIKCYGSVAIRVKPLVNGT